MRTVRTAWVALSILVAVTLYGGCSREPKQAAPPSSAPHAPLVEKAQVADWCKEHGVPESVCTRCNAKLIADFQKKGDWCKEHGLPESQCLACHPELKAKFAAMAPKDK